MSDKIDRYKETQINFMRRQCEATEKVADAIKTLIFWMSMVGFSIVIAIYATV